MTVQKNKRGIEKARELLKNHQYVLESDWSEKQASTDQENKHIDKHGLDGFAEWHLAEDTSQDKENKGRYKFPFGDFRRVHRSALIAAKQRAAQSDYHSVEKVADELLDLLDESSSRKAA